MVISIKIKIKIERDDAHEVATGFDLGDFSFFTSNGLITSKSDEIYKSMIYIAICDLASRFVRF